MSSRIVLSSSVVTGSNLQRFFPLVSIRHTCRLDVLIWLETGVTCFVLVSKQSRDLGRPSGDESGRRLVVRSSKIAFGRALQLD